MKYPSYQYLMVRDSLLQQIIGYAETITNLGNKHKSKVILSEDEVEEIIDAATNISNVLEVCLNQELIYDSLNQDTFAEIHFPNESI